MLKIFCIVLLIILEIPFISKLRRAIQEFDFSRQAAIVLLMIITGLIVAGIYKLGVFVLR